MDIVVITGDKTTNGTEIAYYLTEEGGYLVNSVTVLRRDGGVQDRWEA